MGGILVLPACGGGGGGGFGPVNVITAPPQPPPPSSPVPPAFNTTGNFQVVLVTGDQDRMINVSTPGTLTKEGGGTLTALGQSRFDGGTLVAGGELAVSYGTLFSDVTVQQGARLSLWEGDVVGDILMAGTFVPTYDDPGFDYYTSWGNEIWGDYTQTSTGTMAMDLSLAPPGQPLLDIHGVARLQGTLQLKVDPIQYTSTARSEWILRASEGVFGQFDRWTNASSLFIDGSLRYAPNDVFFDVRRISAQAAMASSAYADASTLASAANLDRAFDVADGFAGLASSQLNAAQRRFLASAASIQRIGEHAQAAATLDSLSGQAHATAQALLLDRATGPSMQLRQRLDRMRPGIAAGSWTQRAHGGGGLSGSGSIGAEYDVAGQVSGHDLWLGDGWLLGSSFGWSNSRMQFERQGGTARGDMPTANVYVHHRGRDDAYFTGLAGYGRSRLTLDRPLDFGDAGRVHAHSERDVSLAYLHAETGRPFALAGGRLTPFASVAWSSVRSEGFLEHGSSGFELVAQPSSESRISGGMGMRYLRDWRFDDDGWMQLDVSGQYRHVFARDGQPIHAAFVGTPTAGFELDGLPFDAGHGVFALGLAGGWSDAWRWFVQYDKAFSGTARGDAWALGVRLGF